MDTAAPIVKNDDSLPQCPACGAVTAWGKCVTCGWRSERRVLREAAERTGKLGPRLVVTAKIAPGPKVAYVDPPVVLREVFTEGGTLLLRELRCPECGGRGWLVASSTCEGCRGRGAINDHRYLHLLARHREAVARGERRLRRGDRDLRRKLRPPRRKDRLPPED